MAREVLRCVRVGDLRVPVSAFGDRVVCFEMTRMDGTDVGSCGGVLCVRAVRHARRREMREESRSRSREEAEVTRR
eukprot:3822709-Prymnesium_polylepis.1